jgi:hypothetical protein
LIIADSIFVDAKVVFMHPLQNYAIVKYDASLVNAPVKTPKFATDFIKKGAETIFFGINQNFRPVVAKTVVTDITTVAIPASAITPRYRATNFDAITVDTNQASHSGSGVLIGEDGTVQALWLSYLGERTSHSGKDVEYHLGLATPNLLPVLNEIRGGKTPKLRILNVEFQTVQMSQARVMGVSEEWIEKTETADPERHQLFMVRKVDSGHGDGLNEGDVLLTLNGKLVTRSPDLDVMYNNEFLDAVVVRKREEKTIKVSTVATEDLETDRLVSFCGATFHRPHQAVRQQISKIHSDVYISSRARGSPAYMYGVSANFLLFFYSFFLMFSLYWSLDMPLDIASLHSHPGYAIWIVWPRNLQARNGRCTLSEYYRVSDEASRVYLTSSHSQSVSRRSPDIFAQ